MSRKERPCVVRTSIRALGIGHTIDGMVPPQE